jgi:hypothetical protein
MRKRLKLLASACFFILTLSAVAQAYYWPPSNVPPGPPPNYTQIDTTYFLGTPSIPLPPPDSGGVYIWYDQGMWQVANHIYSKGNSLEQFHCCILVQMDQPPTPGVNVFAEQFELISDTTKHSQCYNQNDRWGWKSWGGNLYEIWWDVTTREWKSGSGDPNDFMKFIIAGTAVDFNIWSSGHSGYFNASKIFLGVNKTRLSTVPGYYDYFSGISDPYQSQAGSNPAYDPNVTVFTKKDDFSRTYNLNGLITQGDNYFCDSYFGYGNYGSRYSGTFAYEGNGIQFSTIPMTAPNYRPSIELPDDAELFVCSGEAVCIPIFASDPDPEDTITIVKISGAGSYTPVTDLTPIYDTLCFTPDTSGIYVWIFKVTDNHGASSRDTVIYDISEETPPKMYVNGNLQTPLAVCQQDVLLNFCSGKQEWTLLKEFTPWENVNRFGYYTDLGVGSNTVLVFPGADASGAKDTTMITNGTQIGLWLLNDTNGNTIFDGTDSYLFSERMLTQGAILGEHQWFMVYDVSAFQGTGATYFFDTHTEDFTTSGDFDYLIYIDDDHTSSNIDHNDMILGVISLDNPPVVTAPDSTIKLCNPDTIRFTVTATDTDTGDSLTLQKISGSGTFNTVTGTSPLSGVLKYYVSASGTYNFIFKATDKCGKVDFDTATYVITMNNPPVVSAPDSSKSFCGPDTVRFTITATDPDAGDVLTLTGPGIPTPITGASPLSADVKIYISSAGTYNYAYTVTDLCNLSGTDTSTWTITMNNPPTVSTPDSNLFLCNPDTISFDITGTDPDAGDSLTLELVSGPGTFPTVTGPSPVTGTLKYYVTATGTYTFIFKVTDKCGSVDYDTASWFVIKDATTPVVTAPDSNLTFCGPDTIKFTVTATDANPYDTLKLFKYSGPGTFSPDTAKGNPPLSGELTYYVTASGTYNFIFKAMDKCGRYDFDTATYVITMNNPPVVSAPDSSKSFCGPDTVRFTVTATDPDAGDVLTLSGPGIATPITGASPLSADVKIYISSAGTYNYAYTVTDHCNLSDVDTATYVITMNNPPVVSAPDSSKNFCGPDTVRFTITATDPDAGDTITLSGPGIPSPITGVSPLYADVKFYVNASGTYNYIYQVTNHCGSADYDTATWVISMNNPPTVSAPDSSKHFCGPDTIRFTVTATDPDANDTLTLSGPGISTPITGLSPLSTDVKIYINSAGTYNYVYMVSDKCGATDSDTTSWTITMNNPPTVSAPDSSKSFCGPDTIRFTVTATDPNSGDTLTLSGPGIPTPIKGLSPLSANIKIYVSSAGTYNYVYIVTDLCNLSDTNTATWTITMNNPPTVIAPDSSKFFCGPDTIRFTITATDPDVGDTITLSGPGIPFPITGVSPLYVDVKFYVNASGTYNYIYQVTNHCGYSDYDTASWVVNINSPPTVVAPDSSKFLCASDTIRFTVTATDPNLGDTLTLSGPGIPAPIKGVSPLSANIKIYISTPGTYNYIYTATDQCNDSDVDTATWIISFNSPPVVSAPDSAKKFCQPDTIRFTVTATDATPGDTIKLELVSAPGLFPTIIGPSPLSGTLKHYVASSGIYTFVFKVTDKCGSVDYDTAAWNVIVNHPPLVVAPDSTKSLCYPDTIRFTVSATDPDAGDTLILEGPGIPAPKQGITYVSANVKFYITSSGTYNYIYKVTNGCGAIDYDTATWTITVNSPPTLNLPQSVIACIGDTARFTVTGNDPDDDYNIALEKVSGVGNFTNLNGKPPLNGNWWWIPSVSDTLNNPHLVIFKVTDHCGLTVTDTVSVIVQRCECDIYVKIGEADCANPGDTVSIPVLLKTSHALGGFDLRVEFDPSVLYFQGAERGNGLPSGWEYFTYRQLPCPNCGCCKYKLLLLGIYDIKDPHAGEVIEPNSDYIEIARLKFRVANDNNLRGFFINVCFEWDEGDCTQNTFSDPTGYILYVSSNPEEFSYAVCDTQLHPGNEVLNIVCFERCGGIQICTTGEKVVGDINLNLIPYDPADLTLFSSYFIYGLDVFLNDPYWRSVQISNTDVNRDGFTLTLSDFIYMIRVMMHDVSPLPKLTSEESQLNVLMSTSESEHIITFDSRSEVGAALLVFKPKGEVILPELISPEMQMRYGMKNDEFRVLIYSPVGNSISSGNNQVLRIRAEKGVELSSVEAVDSYGRPLTVSTSAKALPMTFTLYPNYPNPFNPETNISFALPVDSRTSLKIYNLSGQLVKTLLDENLSAGTYTVHWDGSNSSGEKVASGIYFYKLTTGDYSQTRKMCMVK